MALPDYTTQDPATYKANIDSSVANSVEKTGDTMSGRLIVDAGSSDALSLKRATQVGIKFDQTSFVRYLGSSNGVLYYGESLDHVTNEAIATENYVDAIPKLVMLDTPELVLNDLTPPTTSTAVDVVTLNTAGATKAILSAYLANNATTYLGFSSASVSVDTKWQKIAVAASGFARSEFVVNLDGNSDFWWYSSDGTITSACQVYLIGYYV